MNIFAVPPSYRDGGDAMNQRGEQLEKKLEQARRLAAEASDHLTGERLAEMIDELEAKLRDVPEGKAGYRSDDVGGSRFASPNINSSMNLESSTLTREASSSVNLRVFK
jgi:hypothetical protein